MYHYTKLADLGDNQALQLKLSTRKTAGVGAVTHATVVRTEYTPPSHNIPNGYTSETHVVFQDYSKRVDESIVYTKRVTDKALGQSLDKAKENLPDIIADIKQHYVDRSDWLV
jgi:hypothetical protein